MSLISCPECGREVSDTGKKCPHCGFVLKKVDVKKVVMIIALVLQLAVIIISFMPIYAVYKWTLLESGYGMRNTVGSRTVNIFGSNLYGEFQVSVIFSVIFMLFCIISLVYIFAKLYKKHIFEKVCMIKELCAAPLVAHIFQLASVISFTSLVVHVNLSPSNLTADAGGIPHEAVAWVILQVLVILAVVLANFGEIKAFIKTLFKKKKVEPIEMEGEEETEPVVKNRKFNIKKRYIIEFAVIILLLVIPSVVNTVIANIPREVVIEETEKEITTTKMWEIARQRAINACCENTRVDTIKGFEIGSKSIRKETDEYWEVEMSGSFYPVDKYGDFGDYHLFDVVVQVGKEGGASTIYDYVRKKRW